MTHLQIYAALLQTEGHEQAQGHLQATLGDVKNVAAKVLLGEFVIWWKDAASTIPKTFFLCMMNTKSLPACFLGHGSLAERGLTNMPLLPDYEFHRSKGVVKFYTPAHVALRTALTTILATGDCHGHQAHSGISQSGELFHYETGADDDDDDVPALENENGDEVIGDGDDFVFCRHGGRSG